MRWVGSSTSNPTIDSLEGDRELRVEQGLASGLGARKPLTLHPELWRKDCNPTGGHCRHTGCTGVSGHEKERGARKIQGGGRDFLVEK